MPHLSPTRLTVVPGCFLLTGNPYNTIFLRIISTLLNFIRILLLALLIVNSYCWLVMAINGGNLPASFFAKDLLYEPALKWVIQFEWERALFLASIAIPFSFVRNTLTTLREANIFECMSFSGDLFLISSEKIELVKYRRTLSTTIYLMDDIEGIVVYKGYRWNKRIVIRLKGHREIVVLGEFQPKDALMDDVFQVLRNETNFEMRRVQ